MSTSTIWGDWDNPPLEAENDVLTMLWHSLAAQRVGTPEQQLNSGLSQRKHEIIQLWELYRRAKPRITVEIGVAQGGTFASWCFLGRPDGLFIGIDRDCNDCRPRRGEQVHPRICSRVVNEMTQDGGGMLALGRNNQIVVPISGWSHDPSVIAQLERILAGRRIDFLFHDASHSAEMFARDFKIYYSLIAEGGVFACHDIQESRVPECNKRDEWERIIADESYSAIMEFRGARTEDSLGIGVLIK